MSRRWKQPDRYHHTGGQIVAATEFRLAARQMPLPRAAPAVPPRQLVPATQTPRVCSACKWQSATAKHPQRRRLRRFIHGEQGAAPSKLHLPLVGMAVPGDGSLHFARRIATDTTPCCAAASKITRAFRETQRRAHIQAVNTLSTAMASGKLLDQPATRACTS